MSFIALFMPASISMLIRHRRKKEDYSFPKSLMEYAVLVMSNVLLSQIVVVYLLRITEVDMTAFRSFPFFTKYMFIAIIIAWLTPYIEEIFCKYVGISFTVEKRDED